MIGSDLLSANAEAGMAMQELDYDYQRLKAFLAFYNATLERQEEEDPKAAARNILYGQGSG